MQSANPSPVAPPAVEHAAGAAVSGHELVKRYKETIEERLNQIAFLLYALLAMSIAACCGRSGRPQTRVSRVIRYESVITAVIGGLLGTAVGIAFAWLTTRALSDWDVSFTVPPGQLGLIAVVALVVGVVGAIAPARRGARIDVLASIRYE